MLKRTEIRARMEATKATPADLAQMSGLPEAIVREAASGRRKARQELIEALATLEAMADDDARIAHLCQIALVRNGLTGWRGSYMS